MKSTLVALTLIATLAATAPAAVSHPNQSFASVPRAAWADADPADSLYRAARRALNAKDYEEAARMFEQIVSKYPRSEYTPDALYWKGFALYRSGILDEAVDALEAQAKRFPNAATHGDAAALLIQIKGQLARRGDPSAKRDVDSMAAQSGKGCGDMEVQTAALDALQQMDAERVMPLLKRVLARRDDCSTALRKNALFILAQKSGADREKILLDIVKSDPSSQMRNDAVFYLQQAKSDAAVDALEFLLLKGDDRTVRSNALFALAQNKSDRARKILRTVALTDDVPASIRKDAIFYLAQRKEADDVNWLKEAYSKTTEAEQRANIMFYLAQRPGPETNKWLATVISDSKEPFEQRKNALFHLAQRKGEGLDELISVYTNAPPALRKEILFYIAQRHEPAALDKLIDIAKHDQSADVRKDALFYIGQSKDPKAIKALEDIVNP